MSLLDMIPGVAAIKLYARTIEACVFALAIAGIGGSIWWLHHDTVKLKAQLVVEKKSHADDLAAEAAAAAAGKAANLAESARRAAEQSEINNETQRLVSRARDAAVAADRADPGLRVAFRAASRCGAAPVDSRAVAVSAAASAPDDVRADVFGRVDETAGILASALDRAYIAGRACELERDSLNPPAIALGRMKLGADVPVLPTRRD